MAALRWTTWWAGVVRVGCAAYTTEEEVERVVEGVKRLAR